MSVPDFEPSVLRELSKVEPDFQGNCSTAVWRVLRSGNVPAHATSSRT